MARINLDTSQILDITCKRGDTFSMTINLKDSSGNALTLSTDKYEFIMQVKPTNSTRDTDIVLTTKNAVGFEIVKPTKTGRLSGPDLGDIGPFFEEPTVDDSGNVTIEASSEVMGQVPPGTYEYDIQYILPSSTGLDTHRTILFGAFSVIDDVSRKVRKRRPLEPARDPNGERPVRPTSQRPEVEEVPRVLTPIRPRRRGRYNNQNNLLR